MNVRSNLLFVLIAAGTLSGCAMFASKPPPAFQAPAARLGVSHFAGTALSGASATPINDAAAADAWLATARVIAVQHLPSDPGFVPIGPLARLVIGPDASTLFAPSTRLVYATRVCPLSPDDKVEKFLGPPEQWKEMQQLHGGVAPGSTVSFDIAAPANASPDKDAGRQQITLSVTRVSGQDGYELAVTGRTVSAPAATDGAENVIVQRKLAKGKDRLALSIPMRFPGSQIAGVVVDLSTATGADSQTIAEMRKQIDAASSAVTAQMKQSPPSPADAAIAAALDAIESGPPRRGTLVYLADQTGAGLSQSVLLVADDKALDLIVGEIRSRLPKLPDRDRAAVSWMLDRSTIKAVASIKQEDAPTTLPPIIGALSAYAGDVGRQLDLLQSLSNQAAGSHDLDARIAAEQFIALEDNAPATRVRAYDWLSRRGNAPPGFDPLGPVRERRAALDKYAEASTRPTTSVSKK